MAPITRVLCPHCDKSFSRTGHLNVHIKSEHLKERHMCTICGRDYSKKSDLTRHRRESHPTSAPPTKCARTIPPSYLATTSPISFMCTHCGNTFPTLDSFVHHQTLLEQSDPTRNIYSSLFNCELCHTTFSSLADFAQHVNTMHPVDMSQLAHPISTGPSCTSHKAGHSYTLPKTGPSHSPKPGTTHTLPNLGPSHALPKAGPSHTLPKSDSSHSPKPGPSHTNKPTHKRQSVLEQAGTRKRRKTYTPRISTTPSIIDLDQLSTLPTDLRRVYEANREAIQTHQKVYKYLSTYTFSHPPSEQHPVDWKTLLDPLFSQQTKRFKINYSHHTVLRHRETNELRFHHASVNNATVLEFPELIENDADFDCFISDLNETEPLTIASLSRPDTKYSVEAVPATSFYVYHIIDHPIGCLLDALPSHIKDNQGINVLQYDSH